LFRQRREQLGLTVDQLAGITGVESARLSSIEAGQITPFLDEHVAIARALGEEPAATVQVLETRSSARFRSAGGRLHALSPMDTRLLARGAEAGRTCAALMEFLGKRPAIVEHRNVTSLSARSEPWRQGYELGAAARRALAPTQRAIPSVQALLENLGIHVAFVEFESEQIEAASLYEGGACPVVLLNSRRDRVRNRLSRRAILAHELCHVLHDGGKRDLLTIVSREDEQGEAVEKRANAFAPSFIAPEEWIAPKAVEAIDLVFELGETWGLSYEGAVWHAKNLQRISPAVAEGLRARKRVTIRPEDFEEDVPRTAPDAAPLAKGLLGDVAVDAYHAGAISRGRLDEILRFS
jgi:Zn-dependent peptidase ImmA (M78 family)/transcriptional regulator with XRE-family HTH domain